MSFDLIIHGGTVFTPAGLIETDVAVSGGKIAALGSFAPGDAAESVDATGLTVLPGVIDSQVHFREPGLEHKEDLESGTRCAALGGVTTIFEMPNTKPLTTDKATFNDKLDRMKNRSWVDYAFFVGATPHNVDQLPELENLPGCCGVKMFMGASTGSLLVAHDDDVRRVLAHGSRPVAVHSEDEDRMQERLPIRDAATSAHAHPEWRDVESAVKSTKRLLKLARETGRRVHVLHVSTGDEISLLAAAKDISTAEVTPQHLTLSAPDCYDRLGEKAQMNPPIRTEEHRQALWKALEQGVFDVMGSDHAPHTAEEKAKGYPNSPSGMPGVQTIVPIMLDHVNAGRLSLTRFVDLLCAGPARIFGIINKGRIVAGYDADFTLVDMKAKRRIESDWLASKCGWSPYEGMEVSAWPMATIIRGNIVMREDELTPGQIGEACRFWSTL